MLKIDLIQGSPEWLEWRKKGIGASDIAAIMGVCPYRKAVDVYNDKLGLSENKKNRAMQRGSDYESEARNVFNRSHRYSYVPTLFQDGIFLASTDGFCSFSNKIVEIKVPGREVLEMARYGQIPIHYLYQIQWQLMVTKACMAYYFCYNPDTLESYVVEIYPEDFLWDKMRKKALEFWECILNKSPVAGSKIKVSQTTEEKMMRMAFLDDKIKELEAERSAIKKDILDTEGEEFSLECDKFILQRSEREIVDYKQAALDSNMDLSDYKKPTTICWTFKSKG